MDDNEEETFLQVSADLTFVHLIVWNYYANKKKGSNSLVNKCLNLSKTACRCWGLPFIISVQPSAHLVLHMQYNDHNAY